MKRGSETFIPLPGGIGPPPITVVVSGRASGVKTKAPTKSST